MTGTPPFRVHDGVCAPMPMPNIDTDAIIPSRFRTHTGKTGFGPYAFGNWRYDTATGAEIPEFVLNRPPFRSATMIAGGPNFGCGSSREAAVWALTDFGIRCIIAPSFGAIFRNNCLRNGLLPVVVGADDAAAVTAVAETGRPITVDLEQCRVRLPDREIAFTIEPRARRALLDGLDEIDLVLRQRGDIEAFEARDREKRPWAYLG